MRKPQAILTLLTAVVFGVILYLDWQRPPSEYVAEPIAVDCYHERVSIQAADPLRWHVAASHCDRLWLTFSVERASGAEKLAVYMPRVSAPVTAFVNGKVAGYSALTHQAAFIPLAIPTSGAAVHLLLDARQQRDGFVGQVFLGPEYVLRPSFLLGHGVREVLNQFGVLLCFVLSILAALLWWQNHRAEYRNFAFATAAFCVIAGVELVAGIRYANSTLLLIQHGALVVGCLALFNGSIVQRTVLGVLLGALALGIFMLGRGAVGELLTHGLLMFVAVCLLAKPVAPLKLWFRLCAGLAALYLMLAVAVDLAGQLPLSSGPALFLMVLMLTSLSWQMTTEFVHGLQQRIQMLEHQQTVHLERQRIMQDMHDGVGNQLVSTIAELQQRAPDQRVVIDLLKDTLTELRMIIDALSDEDNDLTTQLGMLRLRLGSRLEGAGLQLIWQVEPVAVQLTPGAVHHMLRIVQESITNVIKHAKADQLVLKLGVEADDVVLVIEDNGVGLRAAASGGYGMQNIKRRAAEIGAQVDWQPGVKGGTRLLLRLPQPTLA